MKAFDTQVGGTHYSKYKIQPSEFFIANDIGFAEANVCKYILRHQDKGQFQDILKAIHYLTMIVETKYPNEKEVASRLNLVFEKEGVVVVKQSNTTGVS